MPPKWYKKWDGVSIVSRTFLLLVFLFVFGPFFVQFLYVGDRNAYRAACMSNMDQLGLALVQYEQDNDETLPAYAESAEGDDWREVTYPYVKTTAVYQCPDDRRTSVASSVGAMPQSYTANHIGLDSRRQERGAFAAPDAPAIKTEMFGHPISTILVVDSRSISPEWNITSPAFLPKTGRELYAHIPRHIFYEHPTGPVNFLFADGHVKAMKPAATLSPVNLWTRDNSPFTGADLQNARAILKHAEDE